VRRPSLNSTPAAAAALAAVLVPDNVPELRLVRSWLDSWSGIGRIAVGMARQGYDFQLTRYDERGWRATFYTTGMERSPQALPDRHGILYPGVKMMSDLSRPKMTAIVTVGLLLVIFASAASAQPRTVPERALVIEGRVLWIDFGSQTMVLVPDGGSAITIDLRQIPQSDYHGFRGNEYVRIVGFILRPSRRIQASGLYLVSPWFPQGP
jgi:hypothetical protein